MEIRRHLKNRKSVETYPKRTPPKATNRPIIMAGAAEPGVPGGALSMKPMIADVFDEDAVWMGSVDWMRFTAVKMRLQDWQAITLSTHAASLFTRCADPHGQLLAWRAGSVEFCANVLLDSGVWSASLECTRTPPLDRSSARAGAHQTGHSCMPDSRFAMKTIVDCFVLCKLLVGVVESHSSRLQIRVWP